MNPDFDKHVRSSDIEGNHEEENDKFQDQAGEPHEKVSSAYSFRVSVA
jgi:hypothetical protein